MIVRLESMGTLGTGVEVETGKHFPWLKVMNLLLENTKQLECFLIIHVLKCVMKLASRVWQLVFLIIVVVLFVKTNIYSSVAQFFI